MGWKDDKDLIPWVIVKTDFSTEINGAWIFSKSDADNRYNEGTSITDSSNPVWASPNNDHTPITDVHTPCGYWVNEYTSNYMLSTTPYPIEDIETLCVVSSEIVSGSLRYQPTNMDSMGISSSSIVSGVFELDFKLEEYTGLPESIEITSSSIESGVFWVDFKLVEYTDGLPESIEIVSSSIVSGVFWVDFKLIEYTYWPAESLEIKSSSIIEGSHATV